MSTSGYSVYAHRYFVAMQNPAIICTVEDEKFVAFLLNSRAQEMLPKLATGTRFVRHRHRIVLTYGKCILGI